MELYLDIDGTILQYARSFIVEKELIKGNIAYIKSIIGNEHISKITFISFSILNKEHASIFLKEWGDTLARIFGVNKNALNCFIYNNYKGSYTTSRKDIILSLANLDGHTICFDDFYEKEYEAVKCEAFEIEFFKV
jgi:hypothetical protein